MKPWKLVNNRGVEVKATPQVDISPGPRLPLRILAAYRHAWWVVPAAGQLYSRRFFDLANEVERSRQVILREAMRVLNRRFRKEAEHAALSIPALTQFDATPDTLYPARILAAYLTALSRTKPVTGSLRNDRMCRGDINRALFTLREHDLWSDIPYPFSSISYATTKAQTR